MEFDQEDIYKALNEMKKAHLKLFSLAPHLTICSPETQKIRPYVLQYPLSNKELKLLSRYQSEIQEKWSQYNEKYGDKFSEALKSKWKDIFDKLLLRVQSEILENNTPRLNYHVNDLNKI